MMGSLMGLRVTRRTPPMVQRTVNPQWAIGMQFLIMPGLAFGFPASALVPPTTSGTYPDTFYGQGYKPGAQSGAWNTSGVSLGNEYTLLCLSAPTAGTFVYHITDDPGTNTMLLLIGGTVGQFQMRVYNTGNTLFTASATALSASVYRAGVAVAATASSSNLTASIMVKDQAKVSVTTTGTLRSLSNPRIGASKTSTTGFVATINIAAGWNYVMPDSQLRSLLANPFQVLE